MQGSDWVLLSHNLSSGEHVPVSRVQLRVQLESDAIHLQFSVTNTGDETMRFTCGLHTYLRVGDISQAQLRGLEQTPWQDALADLQKRVPDNTPLDAPFNVDRVYIDAPSKLEISIASERITIEQSGFNDTVVWLSLIHI